MNQVNHIPVFKLYGENRHWTTPDLLHCESIQSRSSLYDWSIQAHQHTDLIQLLYIHKGQGEIEIEGMTHHFSDACIQIIPVLCVHGFRFSSGTEGFSLSLAAPWSRSLNSSLAGLCRCSISRPVCRLASQDGKFIPCFTPFIRSARRTTMPGT